MLGMNVSKTLLASVATVMIAAPGLAQTQGYELNDPNSPFSFTVPAASGQTWQVLTPKGQASSGVYLGKAPGALIELTVNKTNASIDTLPELVSSYEKVKFQGLTVRRLGAKDATYGGVAGKEIEYAISGKNAQGQTMEKRVRFWGAVKGNNAFAFNLIDNPNTYAVNRDSTFTPILKSLKFK